RRPSGFAHCSRQSTAPSLFEEQWRFCCSALVRDWHFASFPPLRKFGRYWRQSDIGRRCCLLGSDAHDPKRTFAAAAYRSGKLVKEEIDGGNLGVPGDNEIGSGVRRRLARAARHPTNPSMLGVRFLDVDFMRINSACASPTV